MTVGVLTIVMAAAMSGWIYTLFGERHNAVQNELDMDVRIAMEYLKRDLRLSSMDHVVFYPSGPGPYTGITFPKARDDDDDGLIEMDGDGKIIWDETIVYHVWNSSPNQLRVTTFDPRDNSLTDAQRYQQLVDVVDDGTGESTFNAASESTRALFENLFEWEIHGKGAQFDGYNATVERELDHVLGSVLLDSGPHSFKFAVVDKNGSSSGYGLELDTVVVSPSASQREAEAQTVSAEVGGSSSQEYMDGGSWSGNYQLDFAASGVGSHITLSMENDLWEETNFRGAGALHGKTLTEFSWAVWPADFVVRLDGNDTFWDPWEQSGATNDAWRYEAADIDEWRGTAVRMIIKGESIEISGGRPEFWVDSGWVDVTNSIEYGFGIVAAYLAEAAPYEGGYTPNAVSNGVKMVFGYWDPSTSAWSCCSDSVTLGAVSDIWGAWATPDPDEPFGVDKDKSYVLTFLLANAPKLGNPARLRNPAAGAVESYVLPAAMNPNDIDARDPDWSAKGAVASDTIIGALWTWAPYAEVGQFASQVFDTHMTSPTYDSIHWSSEKPVGTKLSFKVRSASNEDMSDAPAWSNMTAKTTPSPITIGSKQYVQWMAILEPNEDGWSTPLVKDVTIDWAGPTRITDIAATFTKGPDKGIYELTVDGKPLVKGVTVNIEIYEEAVTYAGDTKRLTSAMT